jgi:hypothetical protein
MTVLTYLEGKAVKLTNDQRRTYKCFVTRSVQSLALLAMKNKTTVQKYRGRFDRQLLLLANGTTSYCMVYGTLTSRQNIFKRRPKLERDAVPLSTILG